MVAAVSGAPAGWVTERTSAQPGSVRNVSVSRSIAAMVAGSRRDRSDWMTRYSGESAPLG
jgi:hypothetical protein